MKTIKQTKSVEMFGEPKQVTIKLLKAGEIIQPTRGEAQQILRGLVRYFLIKRF